MPKKRSSPEDGFTIGRELSDIYEMYGNAKTRIPANARMSENIEDRRGENSLRGNKLSMQKTRGQRTDSNREFFTPRNPQTEVDRDIENVAKRSRMNADLIEPGMSPTEERYALEQGVLPPGYAAEKSRRELDQLVQRIVLEKAPDDGKDRRGFEDLIEKTSRGYAKGGMVTKSKKGRGDGICIKGHTKGRMY